MNPLIRINIQTDVQYILNNLFSDKNLYKIFNLLFERKLKMEIHIVAIIEIGKDVNKFQNIIKDDILTILSNNE